MPPATSVTIDEKPLSRLCSAFLTDRPHQLCVRWTSGDTVGNLSNTLAVLTGSNHPVELRPRSIWQRILSWNRQVDAKLRLEKFLRTPLEAFAKEGRKRFALDTRFVDLLPRIDVRNIPLLQLQPVEQGRTIEGVKKLLEVSRSSSPSWLTRREGVPVELFQPSNEVLSRLFPNLAYRRVELRDPESGLIKHFPSNIFSYPMKASSYYCGSKIPFVISSRGKEKMKRAIAQETAPAEAYMLVSRPPRDHNVEQDPTIALIQWFRGPNGEAVMQETVVHIQLHEVSVLPPESRRGYGSQFGRHFFMDNVRMISRLGGTLTKLRLSRFFVRKFAAMTNIDMEEAFSVKQTLPPGKRNFESLQDFFTRPINIEALRPIDSQASVVAPADSVLQNAFFVKPNALGEVVDARIPQIKGTTFNLSDFLFGRGTNQDIRLQSPKNRLHVQIYYLAPADYHRFHSAADWIAAKHVYIPGCLPSVQRRILLNRNILDAFERTSVQGTWRPGNTEGPRLFFSMTFVAASMVGGIELSYRKQLDSNRFTWTPACSQSRKSILYEYDKPVGLCMGNEMGSFRFGSTIVLVFEAPEDLETTSPICDHVDVNMTVGSIPGSPRLTLPRCDSTYGNHRSTLEFLKYLQDLKGGRTKELDVSEHPAEIVASDANTATTAEGSEPSVERTDIGPESDDSRSPSTPVMAEVSSDEDSTLDADLSTVTHGESTENSLDEPLDKKALDGQAKEDSDSGLLSKINGPELPDREAMPRIQGTEGEEGKDSVFTSQRPLRHYTVDTAPSGKRLLMLQTGQLRKEQKDSNGINNPICYFGKHFVPPAVDKKLSSLQLQFVGQLSNLLLVWPAKENDPVLLKHPYFACASASGWGKVTRGISASWTLSGGGLYAEFALDLSHKVGDHTGELKKVTYSLIGTPEGSTRSLLGPEADTGLPDNSEELSDEASILRFEVTPPQAKEGEAQQFAVTTEVPSVYMDQAKPPVTSRIRSAISGLLTRLRRRISRVPLGANAQ
ncbi:phosphatidylserine decarboxylase [Cyclospora cayetanensis]|uniref:phosphatidylserine decarboxylase n=1 Tax=Cyclospora cayetanensis TaxID=88456 RepID=A0A1D3D8Y2_9EIME|nr:phosphatidylserine decarboxylase [Cyclospora cayetanensis]